MGSKVLNLDEMAGIIKDSVNHIDDADQMLRFAEEIAFVITEHFGGVIFAVNEAEYPLVHIQADECIPEDGGIYANYDKDTSGDEFLND